MRSSPVQQMSPIELKENGRARTLKEGGNADDDFDCIPKGGIEETGEGLAEL